MTLSQWPLRMAGAALLSGAVFGSAFHTAAADHAFARKGPVRVDGQALRDDGGVFNPMGASLFWLAWAVKFDRPRLESNLRTLADAGFEYVRAFGVVGPAGGWAG